MGLITVPDFTTLYRSLQRLGDLVIDRAVGETVRRLRGTQKMLDQLNVLSNQKYVPARYAAMIYAGLGEKDKTFEWLAKVYEERSTGFIKVDRTFDPLRSDPRFQDLLRRMNLQL